MSARGLTKAQGFGPGASRATFNCGHVQFGVVVHTTYGVTFGLRTAEGPQGRPDLFSGHVEPGMADGLRRLADYLDSVTAVPK